MDAGDKKQGLGRLAAGLAVLSLAVSILALALSYFAGQEQAAVELDAVASVNPLGSTPAGYAVRISFTNESLRPVIVSSMTLKVDGVPVAPVSSVLTDVRATSDAAALGDEPMEDARPLPFTLPERGAQTLTGLADFSRRDLEAAHHDRTRRLGSARTFCHELPVERLSPLGPQVKFLERRSTVELEIVSEPGGSKTIPVAIRGSAAGSNPWRLEVSGPIERPTGLSFSRYTSAPTALRLVTAKVWAGEGGLVRSASLPVKGSATTGVRFRGLPKGYYRAGLFDGGEVLAVGEFDVPLEEKNELVYPRDAQRLNGQCRLIYGGPSVFTYERAQFEHTSTG